ncbi:ABC transporter permease [candidate division KSB1 bacterium]|nr:ABC transporter permease [candidate division KSB1 bacterium]
MGKYIIHRLLLGVLTIWLVTVILFVGLRVVIPAVVGDVVDTMIEENARGDTALADALRERLGLNDPIPIQYAKFIGGLLTGDLGESFFNGRSVSKEIKDRLPVSLELGIIGLTATIVVAVPMGIVSALKQDTWVDYVLRSYAVGSSSVPSFWIAIVIITYASLWWRWAPPLEFLYLHEDPIAHIKIMLLPGLIIGLTPSGSFLRIMRGQMLEVLRQDYVRTARAKGLSETTVIFRHALRNGLIPIITIIGLILPGVIAGTVLFEIIFILPGMGRYLVESLRGLDYPVIQGTNIVFALLIVGSNIIVDLSYAWIDPRIRYS